jgi:hypothetical protein
LAGDRRDALSTAFLIGGVPLATVTAQKPLWQYSPSSRSTTQPNDTREFGGYAGAQLEH